MLMRWLNLIGDIMSNIISSKKLEANRRNALKSTGPKTKEGKLFASQNALKHSLNAEKFLVIGENLEEVNLLIERMMDYLKPKGISQEIIAEKIIELAIRLKRIGVIEAGVFNQEMLEHEADEYKAKTAQKLNLKTLEGTIMKSNEIVRLQGLAFGRDCNHGSSILKLNTIEDKLLSKYIKLIEYLRAQQKGGSNEKN